MSDNEKEEITADYKFLLEALTRRMDKMMDTKLTAFGEEFHPQSDNQQEHASSRASKPSQRRHRRAPEGRGKQRDELAGLKLKIPPFHGKVGLDAYLEWEKKIELVFNCQQFTQANKIQIAATEFMIMP